MEGISKKQVDPKLKQKALAVIIHLLGDNLLRAFQRFELAKEMWDRLRKRYSGRTVINKLALTNNLLKMTYS